MIYTPLMKKTGFTFLCLSFLCCNILLGQNKWQKCGFSVVEAGMESRNPGFGALLKAKKAERRQQLVTARKTSGSVLSVTVPVVFHIILNQHQLGLIGDSIGIANRVISQIQVLNEDYNRANADSSNIPAAFKPYYGNVNIKFGLAHTDPQGNRTNGWEIRQTNYVGFDVTTNYNSGAGAKHTSTGGADAWDVSKYVNVWIVNMLDGSDTNSTIIGLTVMPEFTDSFALVYGVYNTITDPYPKDEMGILIRYDAFGRRTSPGEYFFPNIDLGRTLTHEIGHYFGLFHPWGDDGGLCPWNGGEDDGIPDTPPEGNNNYHCPAFPLLDACSVASPGVMFMDYMDYSDDACLNMFTLDQINLMDSYIQLGGESHSLTSYPQLLNYPDSSANYDNTPYLGPNPSTGITYVNFSQLPQGFESISVYNIAGQHLMDINTSNQATTYYPIDLSRYGKGMYIIKMHFDTKTDIRKVIIL